MGREASMIPKLRLDALTNGVFVVAMTLLVIDLRLPENFHPRDAADLLNHLLDMKAQLLVYVVSFYVLGLRWVGMVRLGPRGGNVSHAFAAWALVACNIPPDRGRAGRSSHSSNGFFLRTCRTDNTNRSCKFPRLDFQAVNCSLFVPIKGSQSIETAPS
jgi:hypothetical protein